MDPPPPMPVSGEGTCAKGGGGGSDGHAPGRPDRPILIEGEHREERQHMTLDTQKYPTSSTVLPLPVPTDTFTRSSYSGTPPPWVRATNPFRRDCNFKAVTAETHMDYAIPDAFIGGLQSPSIRQPLLATSSLSAQAAFDQARSLNMAFENSQSCETNLPIKACVKDSGRTSSTRNSPEEREQYTASASNSKT
ncbi:hypothetical protein FGIG_11648 [Fasciola gigantica]|uniref:Uncharacterized protein n=1 Tax=Fasciola gigantica TaxID=46835 RepID=A0A504YF53_FASGI|nr:hypothetical protein FGIG_11648 [Fasciola gigantica]